MPSNMEIKIWQKGTLFKLKKLTKDMEGREIPEEFLKLINPLIVETEAMMDQEDIAFVEKKIAEL